MTARLLVVDDEVSVRTLLCRYFQQLGYEVAIAADGKSAIDQFHAFQPHLVVLDLNLPDINGYRLCQTMQDETGVYVLMLTSRNAAADRLHGFQQGADDYITKPFNLPEVGARVAAILKRQRPVAATAEPLLQFHDLIVNPDNREVRRGEKLIPLTALEFNLLYAMAQNPRRVWRRPELIQAVWPENHSGDERVVDVHIGQIRKKLETTTNQPELIRTVRGVGYKFEPPGVADVEATPALTTRAASLGQ
ncbi:MAG: response regulator transcription factor [Cyanobacteria bacterium J06642_2]